MNLECSDEPPVDEREEEEDQVEDDPVHTVRLVQRVLFTHQITNLRNEFRRSGG